MKVKGIGFIGFGEVGYQLAKGISPQFKGRLMAFDVAVQNTKFADDIRKRAENTKVEMVESVSDVADGCEVIFACVPATYTANAASQMAPFLQSRHTYLDVSAAHPSIKKEIAVLVKSRKAAFGDIAITGPVKLLGHQVPMMLSGHIPERAYSSLVQLGMQIEVISEQPGDASAIKLCRSIFTKGLEALLVECVLTAQSMNVDRKVLESIEHTLSQQSFLGMANRYITSNAIHAERRVHEVEEAAGMMVNLGINPLVTKGVLARMKWCAQQDGRSYFGLEQPTRYKDVISYYLDAERKEKGGVQRAESNG